jgi:hypothetical protein
MIHLLRKMVHLIVDCIPHCLTFHPESEEINHNVLCIAGPASERKLVYCTVDPVILICALIVMKFSTRNPTWLLQKNN